MRNNETKNRTQESCSPICLAKGCKWEPNKPTTFWRPLEAEARRLWEKEAHSLTPTSVGGKKLTPISSFQIPVHMYIWIFSRGRFIWLSEFINFLWLAMSGSFIGNNSKREEEVINKPALQEMLIKATPRHRFGRVRMGSLWGPELLCPATLFVGMDSQQCTSASNSKDDPEVSPTLLCLCLQTPSEQQTSTQERAAAHTF